MLFHPSKRCQLTTATNPMPRETPPGTLCQSCHLRGSIEAAMASRCARDLIGHCIQGGQGENRWGGGEICGFRRGIGTVGESLGRIGPFPCGPRDHDATMGTAVGPAGHTSSLRRSGLNRNSRVDVGLTAGSMQRCGVQRDRQPDSDRSGDGAGCRPRCGVAY